MSYIIDRVIIFFMSVYFFFVIVRPDAGILLMYSPEIYVNDIVIILVVVIVICMISYLESRRAVNIITLIYGVAAVFMPPFVALSPVIIYDIYGKRFFVQAVLMLMAMIKAAEIYSINCIACIAFLSLFACMLNYKSTRNEKLEVNLKRVRDDSKEKNIILEEKNKALIERQDNDLYVATLKERNRIAREIHDNVGHILTRSILQMGALMTIYKEEPLNGQLSLVKESLDTAMNSVRESVHDLHDESIDLKQAVSGVLVSLKDKFEYKLDYDMSKNIERQYKYAIIGIVKEAVSNIIKYSNNDMVDIILREHPAMYQLIIHDYAANKNVPADNDNGDGDYQGDRYKGTKSEYDLEAASGIGLRNMRDRVETLNGTITITTGNGFKIFVTLPKNI